MSLTEDIYTLDYASSNSLDYSSNLDIVARISHIGDIYALDYLSSLDIIERMSRTEDIHIDYSSNPDIIERMSRTEDIHIDYSSKPDIIERMLNHFDIYDIRAYFKFSDQYKAIRIAKKFGITKYKFLEMKKNAGFTNWTKEKRKCKKLVQDHKECEIIKVDIDDTMFDSKEINEILSQIWINIKD